MRKIFLLLLLCVFSAMLPAQYDALRYPVIPKPYELLPFSGSFSFDAATVILLDNKTQKKDVEFFRSQVKKLYGIELKYTSKKNSGNCIYISQDSADIPYEGYNLFINRTEINIYGGAAGTFYALETVLQLIHPASGALAGPGKFMIPSCSIVDQPRFAWRGMHLDVARHFFPAEEVKDYLRYMALYKLNTFHWHLTDDQGWRIEIKKYPKLTSVGAYRNSTLIGHYGEAVPRYDSIHYGGFYTQEQIRDIVKFADSLHITIVPEIEMPGHALAMLAAYPDLGCTPGPFAVSNTWGVFGDVLCPTEHTFSFLDDVLQEVCALFPGKYIHIGGDECPKEQWKASAFCQDLMQKNKLKTEDELQSWFTQRIVKMLQQKNKEAIGWDEILEGGLAEGAAVMSWRGEEGGMAAAKAKHKVVMSPGAYCYFDHYQSQNAGEPLAIGGYLPIEKVYSYDPVPASLNAEEQHYILGVQANLWTEYIPDFKQVQYMIFPRMTALAEVGWDQTKNKDWNFFLARMIPHLQLLDRMNVRYAKSVFEIKATLQASPNGEGVLLSLSTFSPAGKIFYSTDAPLLSSAYASPVLIKGEETIYAAVQHGDQVISPVYMQAFHKNLATGKPVVLKDQPSKSYNTGGSFTLVDGIEGRPTPWLGSEWLGWYGDTLNATIDLGKATDISSVSIHFLVDKSNWIWAPKAYSILISSDNIHFTPAKNNIPQQNEAGQCTFNLEHTQARYIRIIAEPIEKIEDGNAGAGRKAWLFVSEIEIR